ncbi:unnamed protein product [Aspergillus oryzae]|uniref:Unnamed protein product n=2 Tax=Aspergillus oryzae TaxID=5062 RepID=A0AAN5C0Z2_ASPOZ|nr:unnamed protein product [Aspergillus oryzae]GMF95766.1 unnamed protein product [Aspergillus oryzae]GMG12561.1 unnamed protein product [Aspergillus oryzae]GMG35015.1 unnamed protein product [Aspergillus oryzae]GMG54794.1 unnamed protein product [Aspergillus oryzae var. brunneus]
MLKMRCWKSNKYCTFVWGASDIVPINRWPSLPTHAPQSQDEELDRCFVGHAGIITAAVDDLSYHDDQATFHQSNHDDRNGDVK